MFELDPMTMWLKLMELWLLFCAGAWFLERFIANVLYLIVNHYFKEPRLLASRTSRPKRQKTRKGKHLAQK